MTVCSPKEVFDILIPQYEPVIEQPEKDAVAEYLDSGGFLVEYKHTEKFEKQLADFLRVKYVSMVPSGTAALYLSLVASGIGVGDKVIVPDFTMIATANAVRMTGAEVELWDIEEDSYCLDYDCQLVDDRTKAIIYVDINGRAGDIKFLAKQCRKKSIVLIEDACQAFGSKHEGKYLGTFGRFGCFSLSFHKLITTGQGGFIVTHNKKDYEAIERLKDHGRLKGGADIHRHRGFNFKYTDLQAVFGMAQLERIESMIATKRTLYQLYYGEKAPKGYVPWFFEAHSHTKRNKLAKAMRQAGIGTRPFYPPIHSQPIYPKGDFPVATWVSETGLWLPSSLNLTIHDIKMVKGVLNENL